MDTPKDSSIYIWKCNMIDTPKGTSIDTSKDGSIWKCNIWTHPRVVVYGNVTYGHTQET